jgi:hypothetical protein
MAQSMPCLSQLSSGSLTVELGMEPPVRILPGQSWANKQRRREEVALLVPWMGRGATVHAPSLSLSAFLTSVPPLRPGASRRGRDVVETKEHHICRYAN